MQFSRSTSGRPLSALAIGAAGAIFGIVLPSDEPEALAVILLGSGLAAAAIIDWVVPSRGMASKKPRHIPIRFFEGIGRFELQSRGDGRRVDVTAHGVVVAKLIARDTGDELVVDFAMADEPDVDDLGSAIGLAMEMVATADKDLAPERELVAGRYRQPLRVIDERVSRGGSRETDDPSRSFHRGLGRHRPKPPLTRHTHPTV